MSELRPSNHVTFPPSPTIEGASDEACCSRPVGDELRLNAAGRAPSRALREVFFAKPPVWKGYRHPGGAFLFGSPRACQGTRARGRPSKPSGACQPAPIESPHWLHTGRAGRSTPDEGYVRDRRPSGAPRIAAAAHGGQVRSSLADDLTNLAGSETGPCATRLAPAEGPLCRPSGIFPAPARAIPAAEDPLQTNLPRPRDHLFLGREA